MKRASWHIGMPATSYAADPDSNLTQDLSVFLTGSYSGITLFDVKLFGFVWFSDYWTEG